MGDLLVHCQLLDVGGRKYRVLSSAEQSSRVAGDFEADIAARTPAYDCEDDAEAEDDPNIVEDRGQFMTRLDMDAEVLPFVIGAKGRTKQRIEQDTGARLSVPRKDPSSGGGTSSSEIVIRGTSRGSVARARTQTELVISSALASNRLDYNYFLSLPLASPRVRAAMESFKQRVLGEPSAAAAGIEDSIFMKPAHLHLTLAMLKLYCEERRQRARQVLQSLAPAVQGILEGHSPLRVQLQGLEYMNDDPSQMHVMYLGVRDPPGDAGALQRLRELCAAVVGAFSEAGLLLPQDEREVKLHATVINTRYRRQGGAPSQGQQQAQQAGSGQPGRQRFERQRFERQPYDGQLLLRRYKDVDFGVIELPAVHLSQRGEYGEDGYYACVDRLPLAA